MWAIMKCDKCRADLNEVCKCEYKQTDDYILCNDCYDEDYFVCYFCGIEFEKRRRKWIPTPSM